uniref:Tail tape measure protein n=1 Tax=Myoviridae sp. ctgpD8 TaxID=2825149 RepID=A0A8S5QIZ1_9CAUD|nr:MAG TPA: tail tape measure protein [Myoviridae sp. ctgpD8]
MNPIKLEIFLDDKTLAGMRSVEGNVDNMEAFTKRMIGHLKLELKDLEKEYRNLQKQGLAGDREMADIQALKGAISGLKEQLKEYEAAKKRANETPIISNDPAPKLNSVKMSMAQIARELPALAMGPQMFFLAISNNIPIFTDALGNARKEYERLTAAGQKAMPVWKQVLKSLFSWQTAMATVITLSVVYGKEIGKFISQIRKGSKAALEMADAQEKINDSLDTSSLGKQLVTIRSLQERWNQLGNNLAEKKKFIADNKDEFDKLGVSVSNVDEAENALVTNTEAFIQAMTLRAEAAAAFKLAAEESEKALKAQVEIDKRKKDGPSWKDKAVSFLFFDSQRTPGSISNKQGTSKAETVWNANIEKQNAVKKTAEQDAETYTKTYNAKLIESARKLKEAGITEKAGKKGNSKGTIFDYTAELADARLRAQQKVEAARIAVMVEGREKRKAIAAKEYNDTLAAIDKEERDTLAKLEKSRKAGRKVTPEEEKLVKDGATEQRVLAQVQYLQNTYNIEKEWRDKNRQDWIDYNKEYGTYQDKRLAITQDYALKIARAETEGEKGLLKKKRENDLKELDFGEFKKTVNLADVFGNLDEQSTETLSALRDKLKEYINGAAKELRPSDLKELQNALTDIDLKIADRKPFQELKRSLAEYSESQAAVENAQKDLNTVMAGGAVVTGMYKDETGKLVAKLLTQEQAEKNLSEAQNNRLKKQVALAQSLQGVAGKMSSYGQAADTIISTLEGFGVNMDENVKMVVEGFNTMSEGISQFAQSLLSMDIGGMISGVVNTVGGAIKSVGSLFGADWGGERSERRYRQAKEKYESYMDVLDRVISKQKELVASMEADDFANADNSYERARELLKKQQDYAREIGKAYLNAGASKGFLGVGSSASHGTDQRKDISRSAWEQARKVLGSDFDKYGIGDGRMTGLFDLSYEQLVRLRDEASGFWSELHEDTQDYLNQIIESEEAWKEVQEARKEALTKTDFDSFYNSFVSMLSDMDATSEDFADSFEKYLQNAIFSALVATQYKGRIQKLYDSWADMADKDGLSSTEAEKLRGDYQKIINEMLAQREQIMGDFGWEASPDTGSQSGRGGVFTAMSQEQGTKLEGLFTSLQDHASGMHKLLEELTRGHSADHDIFLQIAENTAYCKILEDIFDLLTSKDRDGWKTI